METRYDIEVIEDNRWLGSWDLLHQDYLNNQADWETTSLIDFPKP